MDKQCRLCARPSNDAIFYDLFDPDENYLHYVKKIHKLLPIVINDSDPFPKVLCHRCAFKISEFYEFRINCLRTQDSFKTKLNRLNSSHAEGSKKNADYTPMVELKVHSLDNLSAGENLNSNTSLSQDDSLIVIDDDESLSTSMDERNAFNDEDKNCDGSNAKKKSSTAKKSSIWDSRHSKTFVKRKRRKKKSCKIDQIFSTPTSVYQNLSQLDVIDPSEYIATQAPNNNAQPDNIEASNNGTCNSQEVSESGNTPENSVSPSLILVTKIPTVGNAYTCKLCRRTFLKSESALKHKCDTMSQHTKKRRHDGNVGKKRKRSAEIKQNNCSDHNR